MEVGLSSTDSRTNYQIIPQSHDLKVKFNSIAGKEDVFVP